MKDKFGFENGYWYCENCEKQQVQMMDCDDHKYNFDGKMVCFNCYGKLVCEKEQIQIPGGFRFTVRRCYFCGGVILMGPLQPHPDLKLVEINNAKCAGCGREWNELDDAPVKAGSSPCYWSENMVLANAKEAKTDAEIKEAIYLWAKRRKALGGRNPFPEIIKTMEAAQ
jgi:hypothetical protein